MSISKEITIGESKLPAQIHRNCMHEKQMVIVRQIIKRKNRGEDYREDDVPHLWGNYFPGDFKMRGVTKDDQGFGSSLWQECFSWINNYVKGRHWMNMTKIWIDCHQQERTVLLEHA